MERPRLALKTVGHGTLARLPGGEPCEPDVRRKVEQKGQVGNHSVRRKGIQPPQGVQIESASVSLVGEGRIVEPVAEYPVAFFQRGDDHVRDQLRPTGEKQQDLRARRRRFICRVVLEQGFNMSALQHFAHYTGGKGGRDGMLNQADVKALLLSPVPVAEAVR